MSAEKSVQVRYFASMREQRGLGSETVSTRATDPASLYRELAEAHNFNLSQHLVRFAVNGEFVAAGDPLSDGDELCLIPPVAGG